MWNIDFGHHEYARDIALKENKTLLKEKSTQTYGVVPIKMTTPNCAYMDDHCFYVASFFSDFINNACNLYAYKRIYQNKEIDFCLKVKSFCICKTSVHSTHMCI